MRRSIFSMLLLALVLAGPFETSAKSTTDTQFIDGIPIPENDDSFNVLWTGKTSCIALYGVIATDKDTAMQAAQIFVMAKITDLLLTRAFAPTHLSPVKNGYRLVGKPVKGYALKLSGELYLLKEGPVQDGTWGAILYITVPKHECMPEAIRARAVVPRIPGSQT